MNYFNLILWFCLGYFIVDFIFYLYLKLKKKVFFRNYFDYIFNFDNKLREYKLSRNKTEKKDFK